MTLPVFCYISVEKNQTADAKLKVDLHQLVYS